MKRPEEAEELRGARHADREAAMAVPGLRAPWGTVALCLWKDGGRWGGTGMGLKTSSSSRREESNLGGSEENEARLIHVDHSDSCESIVGRRI